MKRNLRVVVILLLLFVVGLANASQAEYRRNVCDYCGTVGNPETVTCRVCTNPLNQCLNCMHKNKVKADFCKVCDMPLAEMRIYSSIDPETRERLKLGQSVRAIVELDLRRLRHLMETDPDNNEQYLFRMGLRYRQIDFYSEEATTWLEFLNKYPDSEKVYIARLFGSDALRKWSWLKYNQGRYSESINLLKESLRLNPYNTEAKKWLKRARRAKH